MDDPRSDEQLVAAANAGHSAAFEALYRRYRDWVARLAARFATDADEAQDVVQETFLYLLGKFPGFQLQSRLTTFLYPAVKHIALARRRRRLPLADLPAADEVAAAPAASPAVDPATDTGSDLRIVLAALPEQQREVVLMRFVDDMSLAEIATALGIPLGTVKSRLHAAVAALRADPKARRYFEP